MFESVRIVRRVEIDVPMRLDGSIVLVTNLHL